MQVQNRYNAACAAALAASGEGKDNPPVDDAAKTRWRKKAMDWLKADVAAWSKILDTGPLQARQAIAQTLQHWKADTDLAGIRDPAALAKLPPDEQKALSTLWPEVDGALEKGTERCPGKMSRADERSRVPSAVTVGAHGSGKRTRPRDRQV